MNIAQMLSNTYMAVFIGLQSRSKVRLYENKCLSIKIRKTLVIVLLLMHFMLFLLHFMSQMGCSRTRPLNIYNTGSETTSGDPDGLILN